ncbi:MAG: hypothetical protein RRA94_16345 [Bacteroidota bacterium]|nr:hypothetical protein [Bacteroidota bacterium]
MNKALTLLLAAGLLTACGGDKQEREENAARQESPVVRMPLAEDQSAPAPSDDAIAPAENISDDQLPDMSKLNGVEKDIFKKTISIQMPYYDALEKWADNANSIESGNEAAAALRRYIKLQEDFARQMQRVDAEFAGKLDPNYQATPEFQRVLDTYMNDPELMRRTEYIMRAYMGIIQRYKDDPACKEVFAEIERMAREAQGMGQ